MTHDQLIDLQSATANLHAEDAAAVIGFVTDAAARHNGVGVSDGLLRRLVNAAFDEVKPKAHAASGPSDAQWIKKGQGVLVAQERHRAAVTRYRKRIAQSNCGQSNK